MYTARWNSRRRLPRALRRLLTLSALMTTMGAATALAESRFRQRPDDARAVYLTKDGFGVHADGVTDDSAALQQAIDRVATTVRQGIVFIPEGRYCLAKTVNVWQGVRLIGYGNQRPTFVLAANTPGFQEGERKYMLWFADSRPSQNTPFSDATEFTFYSALSNIDFDLQEGNPAAIAVRFHVAQHSFIAHSDFNLRTATAAVEDVGNQMNDVRITGGKYGIISKKTAPNWQFLLMDSVLENQSVAGIRTQEVGFTLIRCGFSRMPVAIEIPEGQVEQLYAKDVRMEDIRVAAVKLGDVKNVRHQVTLENIQCANVPKFLSEGEGVTAPSPFYVVNRLSMGLEIGPDGRDAGIVSRPKITPLQQAAPAVPSDVPPLPPTDQWVNVKTLGVMGDNSADDTAALQAAVDKHRVLYLPVGNYRLSAPLRLREDSVLIGLHSATTLLSCTAQPESVAGVIVGPKGGSPVVSGIGVVPGNPRMAGMVWMSGPSSVLDDVSFGGRTGGGVGRGRGRGPAPVAPAASLPAGVARTAATPTVAPDLLVTDGGGGIFRDLWLRVESSGTGLRVENTSTPGRVYQLSNEHHPVVEVQLNNVRNWEFYNLQTEEENPAGADAIAVDIQDCQNLHFANTYLYRVSRNVRRKPYAFQVRNSDNIVFDNVKDFSQTRLAFDHPVFDETSEVAVRARDFTHFTVDKSLKKPAPLPLPPVFAPGAALEQLAMGFSNASSLIADDEGRVYFTDAAEHKIYRWNEASKKAEQIGELPNNHQPMVMGFVKPNTLLIVAYERAVYALELKEGAKPVPVTGTDTSAAGTTLLLPVGLHNSMDIMQDMVRRRGYVYRRGSNTAIISVVENEPRSYYYAPGSTTAISAGGTWRPILQSTQLVPFTTGTQHPLTSDNDARTWLVTLDPDHTLTTKLFADRGGNAVIADPAGNVYLAADQVRIYDRLGKQIGILETPERPSSLLLAGPDRRSLFIGARGALYRIPVSIGTQ